MPSFQQHWGAAASCQTVATRARPVQADESGQLTEAFRRAVLRLVVRLERFDEDQVAGMRPWPHSGFPVHDAVWVPEDDRAFAELEQGNSQPVPRGGRLRLEHERHHAVVGRLSGEGLHPDGPARAAGGSVADRFTNKASRIVAEGDVVVVERRGQSHDLVREAVFQHLLLGSPNDRWESERADGVHGYRAGCGQRWPSTVVCLERIPRAPPAPRGLGLRMLRRSRNILRAGVVRNRLRKRSEQAVSHPSLFACS